MHNHDLLADLPAPRDDEPPSLRSDIVDELLDHLQCAFRREVLKDGDEAAAEQRMLDRFGDPKKLARRLWRQAMWSRIMGKRILSGLQWLLTLAAVFLAGAVFWQQSQMLTQMNSQQASDAVWRQQLTATLHDLRTRLPVLTDTAGTAGISAEPESGGGSAGPGGMPMFGPMDGDAAAPGRSAPPALTVKLVQDTEDGPPVTGLIEEIAITGGGKTVYGRPHSLPPGYMGMGGMGTARISANGLFLFDTLEPDRYELKILLADGQHSTQPVLIRDHKSRELTIVCTSPRKKVPVLMTIEIPENLREAKVDASFKFSEGPLTLNGIEWSLSNAGAYTFHFDPETGLSRSLTKYGNAVKEVDLSKTTPEDRVVFLTPGSVEGRFRLFMTYRTKEGHKNTQSIASSRVTYAIKPDTNRLELELPEDVISGALEWLAVVKANDGFDEPSLPDEKPQGGNPAATAAALTVQLVQDTEDGPAVTKADVYLERSGTKIPSRVVGEKVPEGDRLFRHSGKYQFDNLLPDRYELQIALPDGQYYKESVLIREQKLQEVTIVCPRLREKISTTITAPALPPDARKRGLHLRYFLEEKPVTVGEKAEWKLLEPIRYVVDFDAETGQAKTVEVLKWGGTKFSRTELIDLSEAEDRTLFLRSGPMTGEFYCGPVDTKYRWIQDDLLTATDKEDRWELKLTPDATRRITEILSPRQPEPPADKTPGDSPGAKTDNNASADAIDLENLPPLREDRCRLVVKFTVGTKEGPPAEGMRVWLQAGEKGIRLDGSSDAKGDPRAKNKSKLRKGIYLDDQMLPGHYQFSVKFADGRLLQYDLPELKAGQERTEHIVCPPPVKLVSVAIQAPALPDDLHQHRIGMSASLTAVPTVIDDREWKLRQQTTDSLKFDWKSGKLLLIDHGLDRPMPLEDGEIVLPEGTYELAMHWHTYLIEKTDNGETITPVPLAEWPAAEDVEVSQRRVQPGDEAWTIEVEDDFWAEARKKLEELGAK